MWHTNRYDNNLVSYRIYLISTDAGGGGSSFKYWSARQGKVVEMKDFHGAVRLFTNTMAMAAPVEEEGSQFLWHTVVSESAHRLSLGFEIYPEQIAALLDSCEGCWDEFKSVA